MCRPPMFVHSDDAPHDRERDCLCSGHGRKPKHPSGVSAGVALSVRQEQDKFHQPLIESNLALAPRLSPFIPYLHRDLVCEARKFDSLKFESGEPTKMTYILRQHARLTWNALYLRDDCFIEVDSAHASLSLREKPLRA